MNNRLARCFDKKIKLLKKLGLFKKKNKLKWSISYGMYDISSSMMH